MNAPLTSEPLPAAPLSSLFAPARPPAEDDTSREPHESTHRHRTIWISDVHLGTAGCKADYLLDFLKSHESDTLYLVGDIIDGWQLKKGWTWRAVAQRRRPEDPAQGAQGHARDLRARQPRRVRARLRRPRVRRHRGRPRGDARHGRRPTAARHARRPVRRRDPAREVARVPRRLAVHVRAGAEPLVQPRPRTARLRLLVAVAVPEAQGEERGQLHRRLRAGARRRSEATRLRRRRLRPHPQGRDPRRSTASSTATTATGSRA